MKSIRYLFLIAATALTMSVFASVPDDAIKLAQGGATDNVILAWCQRQNVGVLTTEDILRMQAGHVPQRAIEMLIHNAAAIDRAPTATDDYATAPDSTVNEYVTTPSSTYVYDSYPSYYYDGYYPYSYYSDYYPYGYYGSGLGLNFNFGHGHYGRHYGSYYRGHRYGYSGSRSGGATRGSGFRSGRGFSGGRSFHGSRHSAGHVSHSGGHRR